MAKSKYFDFQMDFVTYSHVEGGEPTRTDIHLEKLDNGKAQLHILATVYRKNEDGIYVGEVLYEEDSIFGSVEEGLANLAMLGDL